VSVGTSRAEDEIVAERRISDSDLQPRAGGDRHDAREPDSPAHPEFDRKPWCVSSVGPRRRRTASAQNGKHVTVDIFAPEDDDIAGVGGRGFIIDL
jgi:hypothetical protein